MFKENFHSHTRYCDGKNTPEEMVTGALEKGFTALGFSGHAFIDAFDCEWCMSEEGSLQYINEINNIKNKYKDVIKIYCGTELDYFCSKLPGEYEYTIGSVHYLFEGNEYLAVDSSLKEQQEAADRHFGSSLIEYAVRYFELAGGVCDKFNADIIGHFDIVSKFNENDCSFDTKDKRYIKAWTDAVDRLIPFNKPFEINTGAIARGVRLTPYPALDIADYIHSKGGFFILTSDCHDSRLLDYWFDEAVKMYSKYNIVNFSEIIKSK